MPNAMVLGLRIALNPHLDLAKASMDDPVPSTLAGDATFDENDGLSKSEVNLEDDGFVLAQPVAVDKPIVLLTPSANTSDARDSPTQEAQGLPSKGDEIPQGPPAS